MSIATPPERGLPPITRVEVSQPVVATCRDRTIEVVSIGTQGPRGQRGEIGPAGGGAYGTAATPLGGHRVVYTASDGLRYLDCSAPAHMLSFAGVTSEAIEAQAETTLLTAGSVVEPSWSWETGRPIYCGHDGVLTQSLPADSLVTLVIGVSLSPTSMFVNPQPPILKE